MNDKPKYTGKKPCRKCKRGYGSAYDGLCTQCRGRTAAEQKVRDELAVKVTR